MEVLVVSKTKMTGGVCVGGILVKSKRPVRLLGSNGQHQPANCRYEIGQIWEITFKEPLKLDRPHIEDVYVLTSTYTGNVAPNLYYRLIDALKVPVAKGSPDVLYNGHIRWTGKNNGYIAERNGVPDHSVCFYISDKDLTYNDEHYHYNTDDFLNTIYSFKYVGLVEPLPIIPAGTLIRISSARWWKPKDVEIEKRCYVQLSGWYVDSYKDQVVFVGKVSGGILLRYNQRRGYLADINNEYDGLDFGDVLQNVIVTEQKVIAKDSNEQIITKHGFPLFYAQKIAGTE